MPKDTYIPCLLHLFRQYGYDGTTLSKISEATGLGKASLYHHFPGGKDEMVEAVLDYLEGWLDQNVLQIIRSPGEPLTRLQLMCDHVNEVYEGGQQPCLFTILLLGSARDVFHDQVRRIFRGWIDAIATVLMESGMDAKLAQQRGEDGVIAIQGALILSQGLHDSVPFQRVIQQLPQQLCKGILS
jgi:TetR/AcrR family transcriptional regulator, lmrAB and yxaGH operons repressor